MATERHIYRITHTHGKIERLVEATSKSAAITFAVKTSIKAELANQRDLIRLTAQGVEVENEDTNGEHSGESGI